MREKVTPLPECTDRSISLRAALRQHDAVSVAALGGLTAELTSSRVLVSR